jgi:hypothetical protein
MTASRTTKSEQANGIVPDFAGWGWPFLAGVVVRLLAVWANELDAGDWVTRTLRASDFVHHGIAIWARTPWPEGNYLLPAIPIAFGGDLYWSVRIFCALVAAAAIPLIYVAARQFGGRENGRIAAWILALLPFHIYISANGAMTEGPFLVFVLASVITAIRWSRQPARLGWLIASAACVVGAEAFRYDGVFVGASIGFLALFVRDEQGAVIRRPKLLLAIVAFGIIALVYPIALFLSWKSLYGDPFYMAKFAEENATQFAVAGGHPRWPAWFYDTYSVAFWSLIAPAFALTPVVWALSWLGVWRVRRERATWFLVTPILVLTVFYTRATLAHTLLNQIRYATALSLPLLACCWIPLADRAPKGRRLAAALAFASIALTQVVPIDAAWHDRGVLSRQLGAYSLIRPDQYSAREVLRWIDEHATPEQKVVFTPHASSTWLSLSPYRGRARVEPMTIYRTSNLVFDSTGMVNAIRDSLQSADWVVVSTRNNTEGLQDRLVSELVVPGSPGPSGTVVWNGVPMKQAATFGGMRIYAIQRNNITTP